MHEDPFEILDNAKAYLKGELVLLEHGFAVLGGRSIEHAEVIDRFRKALENLEASSNGS